ETDEGADHILEVGGAGTVEKSFKAIRRGGVITSIGFIGSQPGQTPPNVSQLALMRSIIFRGIMVGSRRQFERMCDAISISKLRPIITVFDFADSRKAYESMMNQSVVGKEDSRRSDDAVDETLSSEDPASTFSTSSSSSLSEDSSLCLFRIIRLGPRSEAIAHRTWPASVL
ncbi:MAG: hypothetical protein TREMPRED_005765, partial [Tremellales sp. Tagirdzhanova-0007]